MRNVVGIQKLSPGTRLRGGTTIKRNRLVSGKPVRRGVNSGSKRSCGGAVTKSDGLDQVRRHFRPFTAVQRQISSPQCGPPMLPFAAPALLHHVIWHGKQHIYGLLMGG